MSNLAFKIKINNRCRGMFFFF